MDFHSDILDDESRSLSIVNNLLPSPPANQSPPDESNTSTRPAMRPFALRSRRNVSPILSTSPSATPEELTLPNVNIPQPVLQTQTPCIDIPPSNSSTSSQCSTSPSPAKVKISTIKELEIQCNKAQEFAHSIDASDFECSLCFRIFFQPVTTICGHVFCKQCLLSSLKYSCQCPLCRHKLETSSSPPKYSVNVVLMNMIEKYFPKEYKDRLEEDHCEETNLPSPDKQIDDENPRPSSPSWTCIIPSLRSTCHVILSCGGF